MRTNLDMMRTDVTYKYTIRHRLYHMPKYEPLILRNLKIIVVDQFYIIGMNKSRLVNYFKLIEDLIDYYPS
jgi:hypothetical protein